MRKKEVIMSEEKNSISTVVKSLMDGAEGILTSKTVVGAPVRVGDQILIKDQTAITKLVDMIPDVIDKVKGGRGVTISDEEAVRAAFPEAEVEDLPVKESGTES